MTINDDILNRYLDGELGSDELNELERLLNSSPEIRKRMDALRSVDLALKNIEEESPSAGFTSSVMAKLTGKSSLSRSQNYLFVFVAGIMGILSLAVSGYFLVKTLNAAGESSSQAPDFSAYLNSFISTLINITSKIDLSMIGAFISLILIITGYFFFENLKHLKKYSR